MAAYRRAPRWTEPEQRHLTLAFHPEVPAGAVDDVVADAGRRAAGRGRARARRVPEGRPRRTEWSRHAVTGLR
ncbi:2'-5' RNA ligase family protein [Micrococcus luteus]|uniref:2'-5' RNA ligase family protein n=1 Tax=Micrococcus luteus TaxID=1270 RepID=UPI00097F5530|nr:2'-5' RNA ligase family protein [Micrococcus luteus]SJN27102.1 2'-5' RNA ligase [Micrococcus luteus Mu201]